MVRLERFVDRVIGFVLAAVIGILSRPFQAKQPRKINKILLIKLWAVGDSVVSLPLLQGLRKSFPKAEIDVLVRKRNVSVFYKNKSIDKIMLFEWMQPMGLFKLLAMLKHYDVVFDTEPYLNISALIAWYLGRFRIGFSHGVRSMLYNNKTVFSKKQHMVQNYLDMLRGLGVKYDVDKLVKLNYSDEDKKMIDDFIKKNNINKKDFIIGITPGISESVKARMWPLENVGKLVDLLAGKMNAKVMIADSKDNAYVFDEIMGEVSEKNKNKVINAIGFNIRQFFHLVEHCDVYISNDSGPMHIAAAQGVKTIGLFGPNTPVLWAPYGKGNVSIYRPPRSGPFIENTTGYMPERLTPDQANCMKQIKVEEVFNAVKKLK